MKTKCDSCEITYINGIKCHEQGCPDAWKDQTKECNWCGQDFRPPYRLAECCSEECNESYWE